MQTIVAFIKKRVLSFHNAFCGFFDMVKTEPNAWIHAVATLVAFSMCYVFKVSFIEWMCVSIVIVLVWVAEAFNTVLEIVVDMVSPEYSESARRAKDIAAAAVLLAAIGSLGVGAWVFIPRLLS